MSEFLYVLSLSVKSQVVSFHRNIIQHLSCIQQASTSYQSTATNPQKPWRKRLLRHPNNINKSHLTWVFPSPSVHPPNLGKNHIPQIVSLKNFGEGFGDPPVFSFSFMRWKTTPREPTNLRGFYIYIYI